MLRKALLFVASHKLASAVFLIPVVGTVAAAGVLAYQRRREMRYRQLPNSAAPRSVRAADQEPAPLPPTPAEMEMARRLETAWRH